MAKARRKPSKPAIPLQWTDTGPDTPAQRQGATYSATRGGRDGEIIKRREHLLVALSSPRTYGSTTRPELITGRQRDAGIALHDAWCETMRGSGPIGEHVDSSPDWSAIALANAERIGRFGAVSAFLPGHCRDVVLMVCIQQVDIIDDYDRRLAELREGLTAIADGIGMR